MKKPTRPISSPGRPTTTTEKFPPPLMRFLRSNVGSKSNSNRGGRRSRASPMFIKKKNTLIEEPSSPKVTCIGQVRVRRSKKTNTTATTTGTTTTVRRRRHCSCLKKLKLKLNPKNSILSKWVSFFRCGYCENPPDSHDSPPATSAGDNGDQEKEGHVAVESDNRGLISGNPPRNALLLTRCRSAPYRSSSLASKFWESTMEKTEEEEEVVGRIEKLSVKEEEEEKEVIGNENEDKCNGVEEEGLKEVKVVPLILSRCKSEPARRWDQIIV
ncbi:hypothetical protein OSB04_009496 [Centaurea solstitialis]|uniref:Uncharacterized protein n=1 Tax=Centaurea solstitialis TaxID=347529 RepID=A0AA38WBZ4_9ASTR|nr:hypothetical protein OSB04_009496 [Centaurea solstitialis]